MVVVLDCVAVLVVEPVAVLVGVAESVVVPVWQRRETWRVQWEATEPLRMPMPCMPVCRPSYMPMSMPLCTPVCMSTTGVQYCALCPAFFARGHFCGTEVVDKPFCG